MEFIVFDLEATCWRQRSKNQVSEIIEIGAVKFNEKGEKMGEFSTFIHPVIHPILSEFCTELTSITQPQVAGAPAFPEAVLAFKEWIGKDYLLCSWGFYDRRQLTQDCEYHGLETDWLEFHISLKHQHQAIKDLLKPVGMRGALSMENLSLDGTHHRGIDDARNIAKIFLCYFGQWKY